MSNKHQCTWKEKERFYAGPVNVSSVQGVSEKTLKMMAFGITTIVIECETCHNIETHEIVGKTI